MRTKCKKFPDVDSTDVTGIETDDISTGPMAKQSSDIPLEASLRGVVITGVSKVTTVKNELPSQHFGMSSFKKRLRASV